METEVDGLKRNEDGTFAVGNSGGPGVPPLTPEQKIAKKAAKLLIQEYKEKLAEWLPKIEPVLGEKALTGDISAIRELHDRVMGKPDQKSDVTTGGKPFPILGNAVFSNNSDKENRES